MYQVIARRHSDRGREAAPFGVVATYTTMQNAKIYISKRIHHPKFYFEIRRITHGKDDNAKDKCKPHEGNGTPA